MAWSEDFMAMDNEARLQEISAINDLLRDLRRSVVNAQTAGTIIEQSTRTFAANWQGTLVTDIDEGTEGQTPGVVGAAEALEAVFLPV